MLYDTALRCARTRCCGKDRRPVGPARRTETVEFLDRDLVADAFVSSLDADTDGVEGATYVWTPAQLAEALGDEDGAWAADLLDVTAAGTFEHGTSVLRLARDVDSDPELSRRWRDARRRLLAVRTRRPQPARDDKVVAAWNGLAITALAGSADGRRRGRRRGARNWPIWPPTGRQASGTLADKHICGRPPAPGVARRATVGEPAGVLEELTAASTRLSAPSSSSRGGPLAPLAGRLLDAAQARFAATATRVLRPADDAERLVSRRPTRPTTHAVRALVDGTAGDSGVLGA